MNSSERDLLVAALQDAANKIEIVMRPSPEHIFQFRNDSLSINQREIIKEMVLEKQYEHLINQRSELKGRPNKTEYKTNESEISHLKTTEGAKSASRRMKASPVVSSNLAKIRDHLSRLLHVMQQTVDELAAKGTFDLFHQYVQQLVDDPKERQDRARANRATTLNVEQLRASVYNEKNIRNIEIGNMMRMESQLKDRLLQIRKAKDNLSCEELNFSRNELMCAFSLQEEREYNDKIGKRRFSDFCQPDSFFGVA